MTLPRRVAAYPTQMLDAINRAASDGEFVIPTENPKRLRLQFNGLRGALRAENRSDIIDTLGFYIQDNPSALVLRLKDATPDAQAIEQALKAARPMLSNREHAEASFDAILGKIPQNV